MPIPNAQDQPTVELWPTVGQAFGLGRSATYAAAARGDIPGVIRIGRRCIVSTAAVRRLLQLDEADSE
jgi:hypothetical protein